MVFSSPVHCALSFSHRCTIHFSKFCTKVFT